MAAEWFYQVEGQQLGPVDSTELRRLAEAGIVRPDSLVRQGAGGRWVPAERVRGLLERSTPPRSPSLGASAPPPLPPPPPPPPPPPIANPRRTVQHVVDGPPSQSSSNAASPRWWKSVLHFLAVVLWYGPQGRSAPDPYCSTPTTPATGQSAACSVVRAAAGNDAPEEEELGRVRAKLLGGAIGCVVFLAWLLVSVITDGAWMQSSKPFSQAVLIIALGSFVLAMRALLGLVTTPWAITIKALSYTGRGTTGLDQTAMWWLNFCGAVVLVTVVATLLGRGCASIELRRREAESRNRVETAGSHGQSTGDNQFAVKALSAANLGDVDGAIAESDKAIVRDPGCAIAYAVRAAAYMEKGDVDKALADSNKAITLNPKLARPYATRGQVYLIRGEIDKAIAECNEGIRLDPKLAAGYASRGATYAAKGDYQKAVADYTEWIRLNPKEAQAYYCRGRACIETGALDRAIADLSEAMRLDPIMLDPTIRDAIYWRGSAYVIKNDFDRAIADLNEAIRRDPKNAQAYMVRAAAYAEKGDHGKVIVDCNETLRLDPTNAQACFVRGVACLRQGDFKSAKRDLDEAARLGFNVPPEIAANARQGMAVRSDIHEAVRAKDAQRVRAAVQKNPACLLEMEEDSSGFTPLHTACERGFQDMAALLLALGADVNVRARNGETPLITAVAELGNANLKLALLFIGRGADVKAANHDGWTALHYAANENMPTLAQALIEKGAVVGAKDVKGQTPLDVALKEQSRDVVQVLLKNGAKVRDRREDGKTQR